MALSSEQIDALSKLLDVALELDPSQREEWIASLTPDEQALAEPLREMLANDDKLAADERFAQLPRMSQPEEVATRGEGVGPYRLRHEIGRGGMGSVWLAERSDGNFKRQVALKLPRLAWGAGLAERMAREREIGALLEHPAIARMYDAGVDERGRPYLAFEYIDGQPIDAWCESQALTLRQRLTLFLQIIKAVAYAHGRLVVHRDLKPSNVLVTRDGQAHLLDFGIAKLLQDATQADANLTQEQGRVLTPHYASPEQIAGEPITVASDVYSLGVLLYELLTGVLPVAPRRETLAAIEEAVLQGDIVLASTRVKDKATARALRGELDAILTKAMQRDPQRRYATADALAQDIQRHLQGETVSAKPDTMGYRLRKALRRHWVAVSVATAFLISVLSASAIALVQAQRAARSAVRERVVMEFVADVFRINSRVNPVNAVMRPASPVSLLEGGAQLIQQRFAGQPEMQAELFGVVGGVFSDMGAYKLAADYSTRRIEALDLTHADITEQAKALLVLAQALFDGKKYPDAEVRLRRVMELTKDDLPLRLDAIVLLTRLQLALEHLKEAQAAQLELEKQVKAGIASSTVKAWSVFLQASILERENHFDQTLPLYQQAIDLALIAEGPLSTTAISMRLPAAFRIMQHENFKLAREYFDEAEKALRQLGGAHEVRASFEAAEFATNMFSYGSITPSEAIEQISRDRALLAASNLPIPEWYLPYLDRNIAFIKMISGDLTSGIPLFEFSEATLRKSLGPDPERRETALALGVAMMMAGRHDMADKLLRETLELTISAGQGLHPYSAIEYAYIAENLRMGGQLDEDMRFLDAVPHFEPLRGEGAGTNTYNNLLAYERANLLLDKGDGKVAIQLLKANPPAESDEQRTAYYQGMLGQALCLNHQAANGFPLQKKALAFMTEKMNLYPGHPDFGQGWAEAGLCALETGNKAAAQNYAAKARKVFAIQPDVSPYYKKPLQKLERLLGNHPTAAKG